MNAYDFVTVGTDPKYYFIQELQGEIAVLVGMKLTETSDSVIFYNRMVNIDKLNTISEYFININGPLAILRKDMMEGINNTYIEGAYERI